MTELGALERVIDEGMAQFLAVGNALMTIRDSRLYLTQSATWAGYLETRWGARGLSAQRAHQLIQASSVGELLAEGLNESQARELSKVDEAQRGLVLEIAVRASAGANQQLSASTITRTVKALQEVITTGAVMVGDEQVAVMDLVAGHVSGEVIEARQRQRQRMNEKQATEFVTRYELCVNDDGAHLDLDSGHYIIIIYRKKENLS